MGSWMKTITSLFRKARTKRNSSKDKKPRQGCKPCDDPCGTLVSLEEEVMGCTYEDVRVMWSILDKSKSSVVDTAQLWISIE